MTASFVCPDVVHPADGVRFTALIIDFIFFPLLSYEFFFFFFWSVSLARILYECKKALGIKAQPLDTIEEWQNYPMRFQTFVRLQCVFTRHRWICIILSTNPQIDSLYECVNRHFPAVPLWFNSITMETNPPAKRSQGA